MKKKSNLCREGEINPPSQLSSTDSNTWEYKTYSRTLRSNRKTPCQVVENNYDLRLLRFGLPVLMKEVNYRITKLVAKH